MSKFDVLAAVKQLGRPVFMTREVALSCGGTLSNTLQALMNLEKNGVVEKIARGIWVLRIGNEKISPYSIVPFLLTKHRVYVSFISALHLYGIIEQIPQVVTLASTAHTKVLKTKVGTFLIHQIVPSFFRGFDWHSKTGDFLIAEPEKALVDCLYLSSRKGKQFSYFPELHFPKSFRFQKARRWVKEISNSKIRTCVQKKLESLLTF